MPSNKFFLRLTVPPLSPQSEDPWQAHAACAKHPTLPAWVWDDHAGQYGRKEDEDTRKRRIAAAVAVCGKCPVRRECAADVDLRYDTGVRGGVDLRVVREKRAAS